MVGFLAVLIYYLFFERVSGGRGREKGDRGSEGWQQRAPPGAWTHKLWDRDLSRSWALNWLSHWGALQSTLIYMYINIHVYMCIYKYIYIYTHIYVYFFSLKNKHFFKKYLKNMESILLTFHWTKFQAQSEYLTAISFNPHCKTILFWQWGNWGREMKYFAQAYTVSGRTRICILHPGIRLWRPHTELRILQPEENEIKLFRRCQGLGFIVYPGR